MAPEGQELAAIHVWSEVNTIADLLSRWAQGSSLPGTEGSRGAPDPRVGSKWIFFGQRDPRRGETAAVAAPDPVAARPSAEARGRFRQSISLSGVPAGEDQWIAQGAGLRARQQWLSVVRSHLI